MARRDLNRVFSKIKLEERFLLQAAVRSRTSYRT